MNTLILFLHIVAATVMISATLGVLKAAYSRSRSRAYEVMVGSFAMTSVSGVGLVFTVGGLGRFCLMMSVLTAVALVARHAYRLRSHQPVA